MPENQCSVFQNDRFMDLTIYQYGHEKCVPLHSFGPFVRNHYLFHYVIEGKGTLYASDKRGNTTEYQIKSGQGFLIEPEYVNMYAADEREPWEYVWLEFGGLRAGEYMKLAGLSHQNPVYIPDSKEHGRLILEEMNQIVDNREATSISQIGYLYLFIDQMIRFSTSGKQLQGGKLSEFYVREAISYMEQNYARNITVEEMAKRCKLDRSYFGKVFKSVMGQSPQEFLIGYRMARAAEMLIVGNQTVGEIGVAVGYPNLLHFSRAFKNTYGVSPRGYRQQNRIIEE